MLLTLLTASPLPHFLESICTHSQLKQKSCMTMRREVKWWLLRNVKEANAAVSLLLCSPLKLPDISRLNLKLLKSAKAKKRQMLIHTFFKTEWCKIIFNTFSFISLHTQKKKIKLIRKLTEMSVHTCNLIAAWSLREFTGVFKKPMDSIKPLYLMIITHTESNQ